MLEYVALLQWGNEADGLEVWVASLALGKFVNVIMDDMVWASAQEGFHHAYPSLFLTNFGWAILYEVEPEDDLSHLGAAVPVPPSGGLPQPQLRAQWGHPLSQIPEYPQQPDSDRSDTGPEELFVEEV